jgi:hypothetical protein
MSDSGEQLYGWLPAVYRERDESQALRALLGVIQEQLDAVQADVEQLYDNWFIETCADWVVPYIGDLLGYRVLDSGDAPAAQDGSGDSQETRVLVPRRDVANTIRFRRRKGTVSLLEDIAQSVSGWPCRACETDRLLAGTQSLRRLDLSLGRTANVRDAVAMGRVDAFDDVTAHSVDVRRPQSRFTRGRFNLASIALFVWRLQSFPVTRMKAYCIDRSTRADYTFSVLGNDCSLFSGSGPDVAGGHSLPELLTRAELADEHGRVSPAFYGAGRSLALWQGRHEVLVPRESLVIADLSGWRFRPRRGTVAIDPETGRIAFHPEEAPEDGLLVSYHYGSSSALGGGQYPRAQRRVVAGERLYLVGPGCDFPTLDAALGAWSQARPQAAVIELTANEVYSDPRAIELQGGQRLEIRARDDVRPLIDLRDRHRDAREFLSVRASGRSRLTLVGLLVAGRALQVRGQLEALTIRHCTFVPGWDVSGSYRGASEVAPSIKLEHVTGRIVIDHTITGPIVVVSGAQKREPPSLVIVDSVVDGTTWSTRVIGAPDASPAWASLTVRRSTLVGHVHVDGLEHAEDSLFTGTVLVVRRQAGCMRYCYLPARSRTPARFCCQPDLALGEARGADPRTVEARVRPRFLSVLYGTPNYARLDDGCAPEIACGAHDGSEMGVFHDLFQRRRMANLQARLEEYVPAGVDVGIFNASQGRSPT